MVRTWGCVVLLTLTAAVGVFAQARPSITERARALYYAAEYEQALALLDSADAPNDAAAVELFRGASLFALGRSSEAEHAFEKLVRLRPDLLPGQLEMTPWIAVRFAAVRVRVLDEIQRERQNEKRREIAPDGQRAEPQFYTLADASVSPPVAIQERVPEPPVIKGADYSGTILLLVDIGTNGSVERVSLENSIDPRVDDLIRHAAAAWLYRPATLNGRPVRFRRALRIDIR